MLDVTGAEIRIPAKPSEVFLELWQWRALDQSPEKFAECAAAWRQIVSLEEIYAEAQAKDLANRLVMEQARLVPAPVTFAEEDTSSGAEAPPSPPGEGITYDCASAPMPEPEEVKKAEAETSKAAKYTGYMSRLKNDTRERLLRMRKEKGLTVNDILAADTYGLRWSDVLDMLQAKPVPLPRWEALAKILDKYEEAEGSGGE